VARKPEVADHYGAHYRDFDADVYGDVRREAFGVDVGQNSWLTVEALERFGSQLELRPSTRLLDVACGSGGPALHLVALTGCDVVGVELYEDAVAAGNKSARVAGLERRTRFVQADASRALPFDGNSFDAILCIDSINLWVPRTPFALCRPRLVRRRCLNSCTRSGAIDLVGASIYKRVRYGV
jgi:SAM-dependent methyltransferase